MKKRLIQKVLCVFCSFVIFCSAVGCTDNGENRNENINLDYMGESVVFEEKDVYLLEKSKSDYVIVIEENADDNEVFASRELQTFFGEATGVDLPIISDSEVTYNATSKFISIGDTTISEQAGVAADERDLKKQGYKLQTVGNSVFLRGATSTGSLYAVYDFLYYEFGFEYYFTDVYSLDTNVANLKLKIYDITEIPDIDEMTTPCSGMISSDKVNMRRFRVTEQSNWLIPVYGNYISVHNVFFMLDPAKYLEEHAAWYSDDIGVSTEDGRVKGQLCFSAHGIESEQEAMFNEFVKVVKAGLAASDGTVFSISQNDYNTFCDCDSCLQAKKTYGANSALVILLCNRLSDYFSEWFETEEGAPYKRDIKFVFLAYQQILEAPATLKPNGKYEANDTSLICRDNVGVYLAADSFNYTYGFEQSTNAGIIESMKAWQALTNNFIYWTYDINFNHYLIPYDSFFSKQDFYRFMAESGAIIINDQGQVDNLNGSTAWGNVKSYLSTKLRWNVDADVSVLTKRYFKTCYKDAADDMYSVYLQYKAHYQEMKRKLAAGEYSVSDEGTLGNIFADIRQREFWPKKILESWYGTFKKAIAVADAKRVTEPAYERVYQMIAAELVSPLYMLLSLYADFYETVQLETMKIEFKQYCTEAGILKHCDSTANGDIEKLYETLGII